MTTITAPAGTECPRPEKKQLTRAEAFATLAEVRREVNPAIEAYQCACGHWHHGRSKKRFDNHLKRVLRSGQHKHRQQQQRGRKR